MADMRRYLRVKRSQSKLWMRRFLVKVCSGRWLELAQAWSCVTQKLQFLPGCCCSPEEALGFLCKACSLALECLALDFLAWLGILYKEPFLWIMFSLQFCIPAQQFIPSFSNGKDIPGVHMTLEKWLVQVLLGALNVPVAIFWGLF